MRWRGAGTRARRGIQPSRSNLLPLAQDDFHGRRSGFQPRDFREDGGGLFFQRGFHRRVINLGNFAGFEFEIQVAEVFVHRVFALAEKHGASFFRAGIQAAGNHKDIEEGDQRDEGADDEGHRSVSSRAWARKRSSSAPATGVGTPAAAGSGRFFQARTMKATSRIPNTNAAKGIIQAERFTHPMSVGAARTVVPYFWMKVCRTSPSLLPESTAV